MTRYRFAGGPWDGKDASHGVQRCDGIQVMAQGNRLVWFAGDDPNAMGCGTFVGNYQRARATANRGKYVWKGANPSHLRVMR